MQKVQLHIRQDMLQRLWDKYVPTSSPDYEKIELVYLKGGPEEMDKQPERIELLLHLILKNKMLQLNLVQFPSVMKPGQKQMENSLRRMERYYTVQLKSADPAMYRTVRQYFTLLEQVKEDDRRYQNWQKTNLAIEKQKEEYRLLSLFSERLRERLTVHSINTLRTMERDFVDSLTDTEYQMLAEELIWQEKPELIAYFNEWDESQCGNIITELERHIEQHTDRSMSQILSQIPGQSMKEKLITGVEKLGQREFCLFYHQITQMEAVNPQVILWKENRTKMLHAIDEMESENLQQLQRQIDDLTNPLEQDTSRAQEDDSYDQDTLQTQDDGGLDQELLRTLERELVYSLSETEYQSLSEKNIWQEKSELVAYLKKCEQDQCMEIIRQLEKDVHMSQILSLDSEQPVKERLVTAVEKLEQKEFCLFYHQVMKLEDIAPQIVLWKESRTEMLYFIDQMESKALQQVWEQIERAEHQFENDALREYEKDVQSKETLRTQEKELLYSLLETEYQTLAERLIWQQKPELIAYFRACEKAQCKEIIRQLEKDTRMREVLSTIQKQSAKKKLIAVAYKLEQREFSLFYWRTAELLNGNPQIVIWKKNRAEMIRSIDDLGPGGLQQVWEQMQEVEPEQGLRQVFAEKMLHLQNQYQQNTVGNFKEQIAVLLEENDLAGVAGMIDPERLMQENDRPESADDTQVPESGFGEQRQLVMWDGTYQVLRNLEHEREVRRENIEQQQMQAARAYQEVYHQIFSAEESTKQQENTARAAEQIFRKQYQEQLTEEEIQNICEWSQAFLEVYSAQQGHAVTGKDFPEEDSFSTDQPDQIKQLELNHVIQKMDQYIMDHNIEERYGTGERLILRLQEELSKDGRIQKLLIYIRELEEQQKDRLIHYLADMVQMSVQLSFQKRENTILQPDRTKQAALPMQGDQQKSVERPLRTEDREFAQKLLQVEDRAFAQRLLWIEDREFAENLLQTEDREFAKGLLQIEDREFAKSLLQIEDREFAKSLLQIEDRALARRLLQAEDRELARKLSQTKARELAGKLLQDSSGQLLEVSYRSLWEWGETLLFHPEHEQEREDADVLSFSQQEVFDSDTDEAQQADIQTQVIRRQIEMAKDRNRLQSLIRQINHQVDIQLVYTDAQLRLPQIQTLLQYVQQLDEKQYGVLVKELAQVTKLQKLSYEESEVSSTVVPTADEDVKSGRDIEETNTALLHNKTEFTEHLMQDDLHEPAEKQLRIEDKKFIEKLLQIEDRDYAERLLQIEDRDYAERLLQIEDRDYAERLLQIEDRNLTEKLLQIEDRALAERLLQLEDKEFAERLLRVEDKEVVWKLLKDNSGQPQEVSYRNMWEWGEALLLHIDYDDTQKADEQTQATHQKNHLQSLIKQINHQADVQLMYTDAQLNLPQIQALLQYVRQLDVQQYGAFVRELAQIMMVQKLSYDETETLPAAYAEVENTSPRTREFSLEQKTLSNQTMENTLPSTETFLLEQATMSYQNTAQLIQTYEKQRQLELYREIRKIGQKIFPQAYRTEKRQYTSSSSTANSAQQTAVHGLAADKMTPYGLTLYEDENEYISAPYEAVTNVSRQISYETDINIDNLASYETNINAYSVVPHEETALANSLAFYEPAMNEYDFIPLEEAEKEYAQTAFQERNRQESRYQPHELEYSVQNVSVSEEDQQRQELRMQQETAQLKSVQEQLDKKLKEVEQQLKKVEDSTKAKEDVRTFAEQVKRQLYEELHVEKLRRGLI